MRTAPRTAITIGAAMALALAAAGCGLLGGEEEDQSDEARLVEMINENTRLESELTGAENRIVRACLEDAGHTVHDEWELAEWAPYEQDSLTWGYPHEGFVLDADEAAEYGFGMWAESEEAVDSGDADDYWEALEAQYEEEEGHYEDTDVDNTAFEELDAPDQYDWYIAYIGPETAEEYYGYVLEPETEWDESELDESGEDVADDPDASGGELEIDDESWEEPKPGGCRLEMIEALYGEPELVEHNEDYGDGEPFTWTEWSFRPENPEYASSTMWQDIELAYTDAVIDLQYDFTDCLAERGHDGWAFDETGYLPTWEYFAPLYWDEEEAEEMIGDMGTEAPPLPDDVPGDYEGKRAYEVQVAVDFCECADELDYAETSERAYDQAHLDAYVAIEEDVYAYQDQMRDAIDRAQDLVGG